MRFGTRDGSAFASTTGTCGSIVSRPCLNGRYLSYHTRKQAASRPAYLAPKIQQQCTREQEQQDNCRRLGHQVRSGANRCGYNPKMGAQVLYPN